MESVGAGALGVIEGSKGIMLNHQKSVAVGAILLLAAGAGTASVGASTPDGGADAWADLAASAAEEGELMIYSEMAPDALDSVTAAFEAKYPDIDVEYVRDVHPNLAPAVEIELSSGSGVGDVFITTNTGWFESRSGSGDLMTLEGPGFEGSDFDVDTYVAGGDHLITGGTVGVFAWNTDNVPDGLDEITDILDPAFDGLIGLPDPLAPVNVEWYTWLEDVAGISLEDLAELNPRVYPGAVPLNEGLVSGEIVVTPYAFPTIAGPSIESGAPIDFSVPSGAFWGATYTGAALSSAPHPAAALLFLNFIVTEEGQAALNDDAAAVLPEIGLGEVSDMAEPYGITDDQTVEFQERFRDLISG